MTNPLVVRPGPYKVTKHYLFKSVTIRDALVHDARSMVRMDQTDTLSLQVFNGANTTVTIRLVGGDGGGFVGATGLAQGGLSIGAGLTEAFSVDLNTLTLPWMSITAQYLTAPAAGGLTVIATQRELVGFIR